MSCVLAKSLQSCLTLCEPMDPIRLLCPGDSPARILECVAVSSSRYVIGGFCFFFLACGYHYYIPAPYKLLILLNGK